MRLCASASVLSAQNLVHVPSLSTLSRRRAALLASAAFATAFRHPSRAPLLSAAALSPLLSTAAHAKTPSCTARHMSQANEADAAAAAAQQPKPDITLFDKIAQKQIPADIVYEDDL